MADVGGLRSTFDSTSVQFMKHSEAIRESAMAFSRSMDHIANLTFDELAAMVKAARAQVLNRHSPAAHQRNVSEIFNIKVDDV